MAGEAWQAGVAADGRGIVLWVPTIADPSKPTVSELTAGTVKRLTLGLATDGFNLETTINSVVSERFTGDQELESEGTKKFKLTIKYPYNRETPTETETAMGTKGVEGYFVEILGYPNDHVLATGDKINAVVPARTATAVDVPPTKNTELMKQMVPDITGTVHQEVSVVAGA